MQNPSHFLPMHDLFNLHVCMYVEQSIQRYELNKNIRIVKYLNSKEVQEIFITFTNFVYKYPLL